MSDQGSSSRRVNTGVILAGVLVVLLLVFALLNTKDVDVDFIIASLTAPLILVIVLCAVLGFIIGWFVGRRRRA